MLEGRRTDVRLRLDAHSRRLASGLHDLSSIRSIYIVSFAKRFAQAISNFTGFDTFLASTAQIAILPNVFSTRQRFALLLSRVLKKQMPLLRLKTHLAADQRQDAKRRGPSRVDASALEPSCVGGSLQGWKPAPRRTRQGVRVRFTARSRTPPQPEYEQRRWKQFN